jgi:hypothetical protein
MKNRILKPLVFVFVNLVLVVTAVFFVTCTNPQNLNDKSNEKDPNSIGEIYDTPDGDTRLIVAMHDDPFKMDEHTVQELNITVLRMVIIDSNDKQITIMQGERQLELLSISRSDPVVLSDVPVEPGTYKELRLVLDDSSTIQGASTRVHITSYLKYEYKNESPEFYQQQAGCKLGTVPGGQWVPCGSHSRKQG